MKNCMLTKQCSGPVAGSVPLSVLNPLLIETAHAWGSPKAEYKEKTFIVRAEID